MSVRCREALPDVRRPFRMSGSVREALLDVRVWSRGLSGFSGVVGRPSRMSGDPSGCLGVVGRPSRMFGVVGRPFRMSVSGR